MQEPIREVKSNPVSLHGLEEVFDVDSTVTEEVDQPDSTVPNKKNIGLTIKEASLHYGLAVPTVRLKIKTGDIPAIKTNGPKGPEWRIFPNGVPDQVEQVDISVSASDDQGHINDAEPFYEADRKVTEGFYQANINIASLIKVNQDLSSKLEAIVYRNGYLEAQIEAERQQVKLLTDRLQTPEPVPEVNWWSRFCSWFKS